MLNYQTNWNLRGDDVDLFWPSWPQSTKAWTPDDWQPKALHEYACTFSLELPQFCSLGRHWFGKDLQCSPHLLQVKNPSVSQSLPWLCLLARHVPRGEPSFGVTIVCIIFWSVIILYIYIFIYLFIYFWLRWVFVAACRLSLVAVSGGYTSLQCTGFSCCGARALGAWTSVVVAHGLSSCGLQALECRLSNCGVRA